MRKIILNSIVQLGAPLTWLSSVWLRFVRKQGMDKTSEKIFMQVGILPVLDHYYQPMVNPKKHLTKSLREDRVIKGIDLNVEEQLEVLSKFHYNDELVKFPLQKAKDGEYYYENNFYGAGDAEYLYNIVRYFRPQHIIEIGSGYSTMMVRNAIGNNRLEDAAYACRHICIEPYEQAWLEKLDIELKREKIETIDLYFFQQLQANDILFIDSSHVIRPQGDVLFEYLELLPTLKSGVLIHIHDIFTPKDYLDEWIYDKHLLWNEQYLLEAFLMFNNEFKIIGALNYLTHHHKAAFDAKSPVFAKQNKEAVGFWLMKK
jgi:predicted O-methyltransferase YrrM